MKPRYERNVPSLSLEESQLLRTKTVAVIGCGGLGGYIIEHLARLGVGSIRCIDGDVFEESNLNRQLYSDMGVLGKSKAQVANMRIRAVNPDIRIEAHPVYLHENNARELIHGCDAVVDALDEIQARRVLEKACENAGIPYIYGAIHGWVAQAAIGMPGQHLIEKIYPRDAIIRDKSTLSFTPGLCASMQAALCVKLLTGRAVETGVLSYFDILNQEFETIPLA